MTDSKNEFNRLIKIRHFLVKNPYKQSNRAASCLKEYKGQKGFSNNEIPLQNNISYLRPIRKEISSENTAQTNNLQNMKLLFCFRSNLDDNYRNEQLLNKTNSSII